MHTSLTPLYYVNDVKVIKKPVESKATRRLLERTEIWGLLHARRCQLKRKLSNISALTTVQIIVVIQ